MTETRPPETADEARALIMTAADQMALSRQITARVAGRVVLISAAVAVVFLPIYLWIAYSVHGIQSDNTGRIRTLETSNAYLKGQVAAKDEQIAGQAAKIDALRQQLINEGAHPVVGPAAHPGTAPARPSQPGTPGQPGPASGGHTQPATPPSPRPTNRPNPHPTPTGPPHPTPTPSPSSTCLVPNLCLPPLPTHLPLVTGSALFDPLPILLVR